MGGKLTIAGKDQVIILPKMLFSPQAMEAELKRELAMRRQVYSRYEGKRKAQADFDYEVLAQILEVIRAVFADELRAPETADLLA